MIFLMHLSAEVNWLNINDYVAEEWTELELYCVIVLLQQKLYIFMFRYIANTANQAAQPSQSLSLVFVDNKYMDKLPSISLNSSEIIQVWGRTLKNVSIIENCILHLWHVPFSNTNIVSTCKILISMSPCSHTIGTW